MDSNGLELKLNYTVCQRCGQTTITFLHWLTNSNIEVNPLPDPQGTILPDFSAGKCSVVSVKFVKKHGDLWLAHVATCPALKTPGE